jgi:hypothetical protein
MPMHLRRNKYAPTLDEIEAVEVSVLHSSSLRDSCVFADRLRVACFPVEWRSYGCSFSNKS